MTKKSPPTRTVKRGNFTVNDVHFNEAKKQGFVARSVFKLEEIDKSLRLIGPNDAVLDLGCAPGSWLQYVDKKISKGTGTAVGLDLQAVSAPLSAKVKVVLADIYEQSTDDILQLLASTGSTKKFFDVLLSDMAPKTSGIKNMDQYQSFELCCRALEIAEQILAPKGRFCVKIFEGPEMAEFVARTKKVFNTVSIKRPAAIRSSSKEVYVVGLGKK